MGAPSPSDDPPVRTGRSVRGRGGLWVSLVMLSASLPSVALAWTDTHVQTASASLRVHEDASVDVALVVRVQVRGGWLESLEIAGLDPGLTVAEGSIDVRSDEGERFPARASATDDGRVTITFPRRAGPRRGHHTLALRYRASLASRISDAQDDHVRVSWTFPGWQSGLDGVSIAIDAPRGARFVDEDDLLVTLAREREVRGERAILRWRRAHLPRTLAWELSFEVPRAEMTLTASERGTDGRDLARELAGERSGGGAPLNDDVNDHVHDEVDRGAVAPATRSAGSTIEAFTGPALVGLLCLVALLLFAREARSRGARPRGWLPGPTTLRAGIIVFAAAGAALFDGPSAWALLALAPLATLQRSALATTARLGVWQRARAADLQIARRAGGTRALDLVDATRPLGLLVLAVVWGVATRAPGVELAHLLLGTLAFFASRRRLPAPPYERLGALLRYAGTLQLPEGVAVALVVHRDTQGRAQDARLRLVTTHRPSGTLRLDVVIADEEGGGGLVAIPRGLVVTREASAAEERVNEAHPGLVARRGPGGRLARLVELDALFAVARTLDAPEALEAPPTSRASLAASRASAPPMMLAAPRR
ncbi:MAG: hypothetical protein KF901_13820 [Myxococcales bacterium]|nr:hypothetical protein [Myxococcales bacterium]